MNRKHVLSQIEERKLVAVVRVDHPDDLFEVSSALLEGGVSVIELTMTIPDVLKRVGELRDRLGDDILVGLGSVLDGDVTRRAVDAGVQFVVSPIMRGDIIESAHAGDVPVAVGAYSPTEIQTAWELGSDVVKVFPADQLGPSYFKAVRAPMPHLRLMPTGGVSADNVHEWLAAGAAALGVGSALVDKKAIAERQFGILTEKAKIFSGQVNSFKATKGASS